MMPAIPPTLQDDDELEGDDDEGYSSGNSNGLPDHDWRDDGLLSVNLDGAHPIYELVQRAEKRWAEKHRKASKTLEQAVEEYERRYNRPPPKGFNHWWEYVQKHNVQLPDEYDQIHHDLEPYWGIDPVDLRAAQFEWEAHRDSFTLGKLRDEDVITVVNISLPEDRISDYLAWGAKPQMDLLTEVHQFIPPFRATFSPHDNPNELGEWTWKNAALEAAKKGTCMHQFLMHQNSDMINALHRCKTSRSSTNGTNRMVSCLPSRLPNVPKPSKILGSSNTTKH